LLLRINEPFSIENQRNYPPEVVEELRKALKLGVLAYPDPKREDFYDIEADERVFFVCMARNGKVILLATWLEELVACVPGTARPCRKLA
jgi:hypothetical protein